MKNLNTENTKIRSNKTGEYSEFKKGVKSKPKEKKPWSKQHDKNKFFEDDAE